MKQATHSLDIEFNDNNILSSLFGIDDTNIHLLEDNKSLDDILLKYRA